MTSYSTIKEVENALTPNSVEKYPIVFRRRVTREEADAIDEWIDQRHICHAVQTGCI